MLNYGTTCALLLCAAAAVRAVPVALPADAPLDPRAAAAPELRVLEAQLAAAKEKAELKAKEADLEVKLAKSEAKNEAYEAKLSNAELKAKVALLEAKVGAGRANDADVGVGRRAAAVNSSMPAVSAKAATALPAFLLPLLAKGAMMGAKAGKVAAMAGKAGKAASMAGKAGKIGKLAKLKGKMGQMKGKFSKAQDMMGGGGDEGGGGGMMDKIFSGAENAPDLALGDFKAGLDEFIDRGPVELPKPAELLADMGFLTPRDGFGAESGVDSFVDPAKIDEMKPYPGIDYLGMGYDVYHGNPEGDEKLMSDPGFRLPIRQLSYTGVSMTRDNKYLTPDGSMSIPLTACARSEIARDVSTQARYSNSLSEDRQVTLKSSNANGASAGGFGFSGSHKWGTSSFSSASAGFQQQQHRGFQNKQYRIDVKSYCEKCAPPAAAAAAAAATTARPTSASRW